MFRRSILLFSSIAVVTVAILTWAVADVLYDISLPRCSSGRRVVSCGGDEGWHGTSGLVSALLATPALFALVGSYLYLASRLVRAEKAKRRDALRRSLRVRFLLAFLAATVVALPAVLAVRSAIS
ncbi:hypothetical protein Ait01nite_039120 [Actinoplanes italicus]|uniref:Uncharacterized protein n=1 Tax=Actinoplanes italicus TaxID=113567 RepID=A0A2T0JWI3_9ACTN|nr:hypothetical protein [Actinoplanes italicus]PRX12062.1 hypothetical protein CLV67_13087 [Actinoplanes italicus]GIE30867.1 hypothetical protein Ait01nite_039120 [Actinoplanes italicus]